MRISDIISLGKEALFLAIIAVVLFAAIWLLGYKLIYKKKMHGKKQISLGKMAWVCIFAVYVYSSAFGDAGKTRNGRRVRGLVKLETIFFI